MLLRVSQDQYIPHAAVAADVQENHNSFLAVLFKRSISGERLPVSFILGGYHLWGIGHSYRLLYDGLPGGVETLPRSLKTGDRLDEGDQTKSLIRPIFRCD